MRLHPAHMLILCPHAAVRKNRYVILPVDFEEAWKVSGIWLCLFHQNFGYKRSDATFSLPPPSSKPSSGRTIRTSSVSLLSLSQAGCAHVSPLQIGSVGYCNYYCESRVYCQRIVRLTFFPVSRLYSSGQSMFPSSHLLCASYSAMKLFHFSVAPLSYGAALILTSEMQ